jgi:DNA polymerase-4
MGTAHKATARRILLLDCDQFFVQCARLADPAGAGREPLLLVGGTADARGVVTSASYETRVFGIRSGMPTAQALRLCPRARVVPVPRELCMRKSHAVRNVLERFSPVVEPASIDEAYVDLSGTEALYHDEDLAITARRIQETVARETDIGVSIGGGTTKLIAKLAATRAKPGGVHVVTAGMERYFMCAFRLEDIPGVGPVFADRLRALGMATVLDAMQHDSSTLERWLGNERGAWLFERVRGQDVTAVLHTRVARSVSREETFATDIEDVDALETELLALAVRLGSDLRDSGLRARTFTVKIRDADFTTRSAAQTVPEGVGTDRAIWAIARFLLQRLRDRRRMPTRLLGIAASHFAEEPSRQMTLFEEAVQLESERDIRLAQATDLARTRFGPHAIEPARLLQRRKPPKR